jgi:hypothetical protein
MWVWTKKVYSNFNIHISSTHNFYGLTIKLHIVIFFNSRTTSARLANTTSSVPCDNNVQIYRKIKIGKRHMSNICTTVHPLHSHRALWGNIVDGQLEEAPPGKDMAAWRRGRTSWSELPLQFSNHSLQLGHTLKQSDRVRAISYKLFRV